MKTAVHELASLTIPVWLLIAAGAPMGTLCGSPIAEGKTGGLIFDPAVTVKAEEAFSIATPVGEQTEAEPGSESAPPETAAVEAAENSLGMRFVPVGDVLFSVWCTRVKDYEAFAREKTLKSTAWRTPGFQQGPDHPVVNVTWKDAVEFCEWLTAKEREQGLLPAGEVYRLPTDLEWSSAVGLPLETGRTPEARDMATPDVYPWGTQWPPPPGAGNYTGEESGADVCLTGYDDQYSWTSPVGSFSPNAADLYDMGGNVWQWCVDSWNKDSGTKVLRGASWHKGALKLGLLSSCRMHAKPDSRTEYYGFRVVRAKKAGTLPVSKSARTRSAR